MCQLCAITTLANQARWPKPLEASIKDIHFLVTLAHEEHNTHNSSCVNGVAPSASLYDLLRLLATALDELDADREKWWTAPAKRELRRRLDVECDQKRLTELQKINNAAAARIETMQARLGMFVKWSLGVEGGVVELGEGSAGVGGAEVKREEVEVAR